LTFRYVVNNKKPEPPARKSTRIEYKTISEPIKAIIKDTSLEGNNPEEHDTRCEKSPTGEHQFTISSSQALVMHSTCYHCVHCGKHKDVYHHITESPLFTTDQLDKMND